MNCSDESNSKIAMTNGNYWSHIIYLDMALFCEIHEMHQWGGHFGLYTGSCLRGEKLT
jgi:hypothetical protein